MRRLLRATPYLGKDMAGCLTDFLLAKEAQGLARRTLKDYRYHFELFLKHQTGDISDYDGLRRAVLAYFAESARLAPDTYNTRLKCLRAFFRWCLSEGIVPADPTSGLKARKSEGRKVEVDAEALKRLLAVPDRRTYTGLRDYALMCLTLDTGIRPGEALALLPEHINLRSREVHIPAHIAKTRVARTVPILPHTVEAVRRLLSARPPEWGTAPVFCSCAGAPLSVHGWGQRLARYRQAVGLKVSPYSLRHAYATMYLEAGGLEVDLQRILGHASPAMMARYTRALGQTVKDRHESCSPLARLTSTRKRKL